MKYNVFSFQISDDANLIQKQIAGGRETESIRMYPWVAQLVQGNVVKCGGAILTPYIVLAAAHCLHGSANSAFVLANTTPTLSRGNDTPNVWTFWGTIFTINTISSNTITSLQL